jgi:hypothetical protein
MDGLGLVRLPGPGWQEHTDLGSGLEAAPPPAYLPRPYHHCAIARQKDKTIPGAELADSPENALKPASTAATIFFIYG